MAIIADNNTRLRYYLVVYFITLPDHCSNFNDMMFPIHFYFSFRAGGTKMRSNPTTFIDDCILNSGSRVNKHIITNNTIFQF
jgi:hypothetical protein